MAPPSAPSYRDALVTGAVKPVRTSSVHRGKKKTRRRQRRRGRPPEVEMGDTPIPTRSTSGVPTKKTTRRRYRRGRPPRKEKGRSGSSRTLPKQHGSTSRPIRSVSPPPTIKSTCSIHRTFQMRMQDLRNDKAVRARFFDSSLVHELAIGSSSWYSHPVNCTHTRSLNIGLLLHNGILIKLLFMGFIDYWITASFTRSSFDLLTSVIGSWITKHMLDY